MLVSPYSWLEEYTPQSEWVGGTMAVDNTAAESSEVLSEYMTGLSYGLIHEENLPFLIREHERKFQYGVSHCTIWSKNESNISR